MDQKKTPHVHAKWIKAKADGEVIQEQEPSFSSWLDMDVNDWDFDPECKYRVKPDIPETNMSGSEMDAIWNKEDMSAARGISAVYAAHRRLANAAIARALADGDVVLP